MDTEAAATASHAAEIHQLIRGAGRLGVSPLFRHAQLAAAFVNIFTPIDWAFIPLATFFTLIGAERVVRRRQTRAVTPLVTLLVTTIGVEHTQGVILHASRTRHVRSAGSATADGRLRRAVQTITEASTRDCTGGHQPLCRHRAAVPVT